MCAAASGRSRIVFAGLALAAAFLACTPAAAERLDAARLAQPGALETVPLPTLLGAPALALDVPVVIPALYEPYEPTESLDGTLVWCKRSDWSLLRRGKAHSGKWGALIAQDSVLVTWNAASGLFRDGEGRDERNMPERFARLDAKHVRIERVDARGVPMLLLEADIKPTERIRVLYVALPEKTRMLFYLPQRPWNAGDELVWGRVRDSILAMRGDAP
jgi:hypothetical protein